MNLNSLTSISIINTLYFNFKYFSPICSELGTWKLFLKLPVIISKNVQLKCLNGSVKVNPEKRVTIGFGRIDNFDQRYERAIWNNNGEIIFRGECHLGHGTRINNHGVIEFGSGFAISANSTIDCDNQVVFGNDVLLSWDVLIMDHDTHNIIDSNGKRINNDETIKVGDRVWICCRTTILKGTVIPSGCVVAAGSVESKKFEEKNAVIGSHGKILKKNIIWSK